eukprot:CAMPEP_0203895986 /NCGR_PEP_ID=MMETSP0359-20131031/38779_1 /ASSEMBLY_ACC=CAM_ASM_000338 /TAXON_ID=268821 /ORGANISM="Scrippsiella Hangoei, Strain SHTV-5" /LENGTH=31 /DNA_ID= /DNA_START= /DNA_END= /DNA_ORIENTATION=
MSPHLCTAVEHRTLPVALVARQGQPADRRRV